MEGNYKFPTLYRWLARWPLRSLPYLCHWSVPGWIAWAKQPRKQISLDLYHLHFVRWDCRLDREPAFQGMPLFPAHTPPPPPVFYSPLLSMWIALKCARLLSSSSVFSYLTPIALGFPCTVLGYLHAFVASFHVSHHNIKGSLDTRQYTCQHTRDLGGGSLGRHSQLRGY